MEDWEGESWLNTKSANVRSIMKSRIALAKSKGCDAIDPDNVDAYNNENGLGLTKADAIDYLTFLATEAHSAGMAIGVGLLSISYSLLILLRGVRSVKRIWLLLFFNHLFNHPGHSLSFWLYQKPLKNFTNSLIVEKRRRACEIRPASDGLSSKRAMH